MLNILFLCLAMAAAAPAPAGAFERVTIDKDDVARLPGKRVELPRATVLVGEVNDAKTWASLSSRFRDPKLRVDFSKQKLIYAVPFTHMDDLRPVGGDTRFIGFAYAPFTLDIALSFTEGALVVVDKATPSLELHLLLPADHARVAI